MLVKSRQRQVLSACDVPVEDVELVVGHPGDDLLEDALLHKVP